MIGLTVRWSLTDAPTDILDRLRTYVRDESYATFETVPGLRFKTWRAVDGQWFEGTYVFVSTDARAAFQAGFEPRAAGAPGSVLIGSAPIVIEPCEIIAVVEGPEGFLAAPSF
ncbi:MAG: hypothetical protein JJE02_02380 [Propionibacteriales bacterium]|nr:hypothetical protein [Propionibacteriales bacterium]